MCIKIHTNCARVLIPSNETEFVYVERSDITENTVAYNGYDDHVLNIPSANFCGFNWCDYFNTLSWSEILFLFCKTRFSHKIFFLHLIFFYFTYPELIDQITRMTYFKNTHRARKRKVHQFWISIKKLNTWCLLQWMCFVKIACYFMWWIKI